MTSAKRIFNPHPPFPKKAKFTQIFKLYDYDILNPNEVETNVKWNKRVCSSTPALQKLH